MSIKIKNTADGFSDILPYATSALVTCFSTLHVDYVIDLLAACK
uniref:Uncharacterized protein n=1 Tax=Anguilla anguilla TaxID=7936 RepID=A0A0E9UB58_ANGAN